MVDWANLLGLPYSMLFLSNLTFVKFDKNPHAPGGNFDCNIYQVRATKVSFFFLSNSPPGAGGKPFFLFPIGFLSNLTSTCQT